MTATPAPPAEDPTAGPTAPAGEAPLRAAAPPTAPAAAQPLVPGRWIAVGAAVLAALATAALVMAWTTQQRVKTMEAELVKRQQDSGAQATEARTLARQAELTSREAAAKMALLEARVAESALQRSQLEELIQSMARSRDENVLADVDAAVRVALQQSAITGSAEPLVLTLRQADERLARFNQPRLERVRRAMAQDLERTRTAGVTDITVLTIRLDEVIRQVDDLPLLSAPVQRSGGRSSAPAPLSVPPAAGAASAATLAGTAAVPAGASAPGAAADAGWSWARGWGARWDDALARVWHEVRSLVRITPIDHPEAMLVSPEQAFFLRENLKLRLLNARLSLLSRQFDGAQSDLRDAQAAIDRYFDRSHRRTVAAQDLLQQVAAQSRLVSVPRPDATLAAIATAMAGR